MEAKNRYQRRLIAPIPLSVHLFHFSLPLFPTHSLNLHSAWQLKRNKTREVRGGRGWLKFKPVFRIAARGRRIHLHGTRRLLVASLKY